MDKARNDDYSPDEIETVSGDVSIYAIDKKDAESAGIKIGHTLQLDSKITLFVYLPGTVTAAADGAKITTEGDNLVVAFENISAHELTDEHTITVTSGDKNYTVKVYGMSYVNSVLNMTEAQKAEMGLDDEGAKNLKNAVVALYEYYRTETAYRSTLGGN